jgi:hypothetical protein
LISTPTSNGLTATTSGGAQSNFRILLAIEQCLRQHVPACAVARALRHAGRKVGACLLAHGGLVDGELVHRNSDVEARLGNVVGDEHNACEVMRRDDVVMPEP